MKQTLTALMVLSLLLSGCQKEEEEPEKIKGIQVVKKIEVNKKYDPLTFIRDTNGNGYFISVAQDDINNTQLGTYSITFLVETGDRERSEEITYQIEVADTTRPVRVPSRLRKERNLFWKSMPRQPITMTGILPGKLL